MVKRCPISHSLMDSPHPHKSQSTVGMVLIYIPSPCQPVPMLSTEGKQQAAHLRGGRWRAGGEVEAHSGDLGRAVAGKKLLELGRGALLQDAGEHIHRPPLLRLQHARRAGSTKMRFLHNVTVFIVSVLNCFLPFFAFDVSTWMPLHAFSVPSCPGFRCQQHHAAGRPAGACKLPAI